MRLMSIDEKDVYVYSFFSCIISQGSLLIESFDT